MDAKTARYTWVSKSMEHLATSGSVFVALAVGLIAPEVRSESRGTRLLLFYGAVLLIAAVVGAVYCRAAAERANLTSGSTSRGVVILGRVVVLAYAVGLLLLCFFLRQFLGLDTEGRNWP